jgi:hypothetical protein
VEAVGAFALSGTATKIFSLLTAAGSITLIRELLWASAGTSWGIKDTKTPKKIAIVSGPTGIFFDSSMLGSTFSLDSFVHSVKRSGHIVMEDKVFDSPTEEKFIEICNTPDLDLLIILAHGEGNFMTKTDYYEMVDNQLKFFTGFNMGGTLPTAQSYVYYSDGTQARPLDANWITASELDGKINNPNLVVAAASCNSAKSPLSPLYQNQGLRMVEAMKPKHYIGSPISIEVAEAITIFLLAVDYLNNGDSAEFMNNNDGKYTLVGGNQ